MSLRRPKPSIKGGSAPEEEEEEEEEEERCSLKVFIKATHNITFAGFIRKKELFIVPHSKNITL